MPLALVLPTHVLPLPRNFEVPFDCNMICGAWEDGLDGHYDGNWKGSCLLALFEFSFRTSDGSSIELANSAALGPVWFGPLMFYVLIDHQLFIAINMSKRSLHSRHLRSRPILKCAGNILCCLPTLHDTLPPPANLPKTR